jgi:hypothetical protein
VLASIASVSALAAIACQTQPGSTDDLQALLHDEPLSEVVHGALSDDGGATGAGGTSGASDGGVTDAGPGGRAGSTGAGGAAGSASCSSGTAGSKGGPDGGPPPPPLPTCTPLGQWTFDDCNTQRTNLSDTATGLNTAFRAVSVACVAGISGQAVSLANKGEDIVYVPDQPSFVFGNGVTVAGWFNASATNQTRTLFRKRDGGDSSAFALVLNGSKFQFVVNLGGGFAASVTSPTKAQVGRWTHVAATYDGSMLRLYLDGQEVANGAVTGTIAPAPGPLLIGNDGSKRLWAGLIDNAFLSARALSASEVLALTCVRRPFSLAVSPADSPPTTAGAVATFDVAITNNDSASCGAGNYQFQAFTSVGGVTVSPSFQSILQLPPGSTSHNPLTAAGSEDLDTGTYPITVVAFDQSNRQPVQTTVNFNFVASGCRVSKPRELMITSTAVVDDPLRTSTAAASDPRAGVWTFRHLMESMAPTPADAPRMVEEMLATFTVAQTINGFTVGPRPGMQALVLGPWPRTKAGELDLAQAPFTLQAIVDRFDLRNLGNGDAGEGRFVFAFNKAGSPVPLQATMIFEFKLPAATEDDVLAWANSWHALGGLAFPSEDYNAALQAITERFAGRGARPGRPNGSAINAVRTNEIALGDNGLWQLREFGLSPDTGKLAPATIKLTPDLGFNGSDTLAAFINANEPAILAETHTVPDTFAGLAFLAGAVFNDGFTFWQAPKLNNPEARFHFAVNTCNGCHSSETNTKFLQITPRFPGSEATLSPFLQGTTVRDPFSGVVRPLNDLARRQNDLKAIVCPPDTGDGGAGGTGGKPGGSKLAAPAALPPAPLLRQGIARVH